MCVCLLLVVAAPALQSPVKRPSDLFVGVVTDISAITGASGFVPVCAAINIGDGALRFITVASELLPPPETSAPVLLRSSSSNSSVSAGMRASCMNMSVWYAAVSSAGLIGLLVLHGAGTGVDMDGAIPSTGAVSVSPVSVVKTTITMHVPFRAAHGRPWRSFICQVRAVC